MEEKCVYCGGDLPEKPTKVKVRTRSFEVCCADCAEKTEQYIKLDKRFWSFWAASDLLSVHFSAVTVRCA